jgi:glycerol-3-phosphate acyltransferase PlsY
VIAVVATNTPTAITRYVSLGSVVATMALPVVEWARAGSEVVVVGATAAAALILFRHRGNLARLARGTERRLGQRVTVHS